MTAYNQEMFAKISDAMKSKNSQQSNTANILRLNTGNTYTVRLIPNVKSPEKTIFHYYSHGWNSNATGQYVNAISPNTWGERDPISETKFRILKTGSEEEKENAKVLTRKEHWLVNVYIVNDPTDPENNGKVKILRFGKQLHKIIMEAIEGEDSDEFGSRVFDFSSDGCNLKIKVDQQGDYPTYVSSRFISPSKVPGVTTDKDIEKIYESIFDLENIFIVKTYEELQSMLDEHYFCESTVTTKNESKSHEVKDSDDDDDDIDYSMNTTQSNKNISVKDEVDDEDSDEFDEDKVKDILAQMDY